MGNKMIIVIACLGVILSSLCYEYQIGHRNELLFHGDEKIDIVIVLPSAHDEIMESLQNIQLPGRTETISFIRDKLIDHANQVQGPIRKFLEKHKISFKPTWISNQIFAAGVDKHFVQNLLHKFSEISEIRSPLTFPLGRVGEDTSRDSHNVKYTMECPPLNNGFTWGLEKIEARKVWEELGFDGTGIVVGSIDTGVRASHIALQPQIADTTHSWLDPVVHSESPWDSDDEVGHGTHTIGTIVGLENIGVAPGAKFIACMGCDGLRACNEEWLSACEQFMLCPTKPDGSDADCSKTPQVVNYSMGSAPGVVDESFREMTDLWIAAGIVPVFSIGNSGPKCNTTVSPANYRDNIGVGACDWDDKTASFSSRGPAPDDLYRIEPDISAPGVRICSASANGDNEYHQLDGTSMATPHISGIVALILSVNPEFTFDDVKGILYSSNSVQKDNLQTSDGTVTCNENITDSSVDEYGYKDNYFGYGITNAYQAVNTAIDWFKKHRLS